MKGLFITAVSLVITVSAPAQQPAKLDWLSKWFNAWDLVSRQVLSLSAEPAPEMLFYDSTYVYTTSAVSAPKGIAIKGPALSGKQLAWKKMPHKGELILPDGQKVPVGLMSFAGSAKDGKSFFVMGAPSFWKTAGVKSDELGLDNLLTGVFLHEFSHIRQFNGFGTMVGAIESSHAFGGIEMSDDIVQDHFKKDSAYIKDFRFETGKFYEAAFAASTEQARSLAKEGLDMLRSRHAKYFTDDKAILSELDHIFLSMEGMGQYLAVAWLIHPKGGNLSLDTAVDGFRRKRNQWSQEEGLALFLLLTKLTTPDWKATMFSEKPVSVIALLNKIM